MRRRSDLKQWTMVAAAAALLLVTTNASAAPRRRESLAGAWQVVTAPHHASGCVIHGDAIIITSGASTFTVQLKVLETCPDGSAFNADEDCRATLKNTHMTISCIVVRAGDTGYIADSFALDVNNRDLMTGRLVDAGSWNEPVTWRRATPPMVS